VTTENLRNKEYYLKTISDIFLSNNTEFISNTLNELWYETCADTEVLDGDKFFNLDNDSKKQILNYIMNLLPKYHAWSDYMLSKIISKNMPEDPRGLRAICNCYLVSDETYKTYYFQIFDDIPFTHLLLPYLIDGVSDTNKYVAKMSIESLSRYPDKKSVIIPRLDHYISTSQNDLTLWAIITCVELGESKEKYSSKIEQVSLLLPEDNYVVGLLRSMK
jgi:hypothetical protein